MQSRYWSLVNYRTLNCPHWSRRAHCVDEILDVYRHGNDWVSMDNNCLHMQVHVAISF